MSKFNEENILNVIDYTLLRQTATWEEIKIVCDNGIKYKTASICIPTCYIKQAKEYVADKCKVCTVIGFPNGNCTTNTKILETKEAVANGADEIDMVINVGMLKAKEYDYILDEIKQVKAVCGDKVLKVIIETCFLTEEEKIKMCEIVTESDANFIKTSTGFGTAGATFADIELFTKHIGPNVKIKAAGGISTLEDAQKYIKLGASRLGISRIEKIVKKENKE